MIPKGNRLEYTYFEVYHDGMVTYYRELGTECTDSWLEWSEPEVNHSLREALFKEFLGKVTRRELQLSYLPY